MHLGPLQSNLQEIYSFVYNRIPHNQVPERTELVANIFGTRIYDSSCGWGRLWYIFYQSLYLIGGESLKKNRLQSALVKTHLIFHQQAALIQGQFKIYQSYLNARGNNIDEDAVLKARKAIENWNNATLPFLNLVKRYPADINEIFSENTFDLSSLSSTMKYKDIHHIMNLEGLSGDFLPLESLSKILSQAILTGEDKKILHHWLNNIYHPIEQIPLEVVQKTFHYGLRSLIKMFFPQSEQAQTWISKQLAYLEISLIDMRCNHSKECKSRICHPFFKSDPSHLKWRSSLAPNRQIACNEEIIELEEQIGSKPIAEGEDEFIVFDVKNRIETVALIGKNRLSLDLNRYKMEIPNLIEHVKFIEVDLKGRIALVEKIQYGLSETKWKSKKSLIKEEIKFCEPFVKILKVLLDNPQLMPVPFSSKYLGFHCGKMKSMKPLDAGEFNFNALEDFVYAVSNNSLPIFRNIMESSRLFKHPTALYFHTIVKGTLNNKEAEFKELVDFHEIEDSSSIVIQKGLVLKKEVLDLKLECTKKLKVEPIKDLEKQINKHLLAEYKNTFAAGILWKAAIKERVVEQIKQGNRFSIFKPPKLF